MRIYYVYCTGEAVHIEYVMGLLMGSQPRRDRYPARNHTDFFMSFRVDLDNLISPEIPADVTSEVNVASALREWSRSVLPYDVIEEARFHVDHVRSIDSYAAETSHAGTPYASLGDADRENLDAHVEHARETFHSNEPPEPERDDDDEPEEEFDTHHDDEDGENDDDEDRIMYDEGDPLS